MELESSNYECISRRDIADTENSYHQLDENVGNISLDKRYPETLVEITLSQSQDTSDFTELAE